MCLDLILSEPLAQKKHVVEPHQPLSIASFNPPVGQPLAGMEPKARCVAGRPAILSARAAALILLLGAPPILFPDCIQCSPS